MTDPKDSGLTIFADGRCPLCVREMRHIKRLDSHNLILVEDIHAQDFSSRYPEVDIDAAMRRLHGRLSSGHWIYGLDVTHQAWSLVGRGVYTSCLRWPGISWFADRAYLLFARHRHRISKWLTGKARLDDCDACNNLSRRE